MDAEIIGLVSGVLGMISFVPQAVKILLSRRAEGVSLLMYVILSMSAGGWITYGVMKDSMSIVITNVVIGSLCALIVLLKVTSSTGGKE